MVVCCGEDIGPLDGLVEESLDVCAIVSRQFTHARGADEVPYEDIHDHDDALGSLLCRTGHVGLLAIDGLVLSLLGVARRDDGRDVATGLGMASSRLHGRHSGCLEGDWFITGLCS